MSEDHDIIESSSAARCQAGGYQLGPDSLALVVRQYGHWRQSGAAQVRWPRLNGNWAECYVPDQLLVFFGYERDGQPALEPEFVNKVGFGLRSKGALVNAVYAGKVFASLFADSHHCFSRIVFQRR